MYNVKKVCVKCKIREAQNVKMQNMCKIHEIQTIKFVKRKM